MLENDSSKSGAFFGLLENDRNGHFSYFLQKSSIFTFYKIIGNDKSHEATQFRGFLTVIFHLKIVSK